MKKWIAGVAALAAAMCFGATTEDGVTKERRGALGPNDTVVTDVDATGIVTARTYTKDEIDRRIETNAPVKSVNGKAGAVTLGANDVGALPNNRTALEGNANFANAVKNVQIVPTVRKIYTNDTEAVATPDGRIDLVLPVAPSSKADKYDPNAEPSHSPFLFPSYYAMWLSFQDVYSWSRDHHRAINDRITQGDSETLAAAKRYTDQHSGGGGGGAVQSVNGKTGAVVLDAAAIPYGGVESYEPVTNVEKGLDYAISTADYAMTEATGRPTYDELNAKADQSYIDGTVIPAIGDAYSLADSAKQKADAIEPIAMDASQKAYAALDQLQSKVDASMISATDPTFSNAVLSVGINTNLVASIGELNDFIHGYGELGATSLGGLVLALLGAAALLRKKTSLLETDGKASNTFATDLLGKQVAISAIDDRIKTNAESATEPTNAVTLNDNAPKTVTVATATADSLAVTFGTARNGGLRICELYILNGTADTDLTFDAATVSFVATSDSFPACEAGINYFVFAEVAANLWKVTRETLKSITTPTPVAAA